MLFIFLFFVGFIVIFFFTIRFATMFMAKSIGKQADERNEEVRIITGTEKAPKGWTEKLESKISSRGSSPEIKEKAKKKVIKRLENLTQFFKNSPLVYIKEGEEKENLLKRLREVKDFWEERNWEEIISS